MIRVRETAPRHRHPLSGQRVKKRYLLEYVANECGFLHAPSLPCQQHARDRTALRPACSRWLYALPETSSCSLHSSAPLGNWTIHIPGTGNITGSKMLNILVLEAICTATQKTGTRGERRECRMFETLCSEQFKTFPISVTTAPGGSWKKTLHPGLPACQVSEQFAGKFHGTDAYGTCAQSPSVCKKHPRRHLPQSLG